MSNEVLMYLMIGCAVLFVVILIAYYILNNKLRSKETKYIAQLVEGTKENGASLDVFYQKFYVRCAKIPFLRRYLLKVRRRLEVINLEDEYLTRKQTAQIVSKGLAIVFPLTLFIIFFSWFIRIHLIIIIVIIISIVVIIY